VVIETRGSSPEYFGQGKTRSMKMKDFLGELQNGNDNLYLSAQDVSIRPRGMFNWRHAAELRSKGVSPIALASNDRAQGGHLSKSELDGRPCSATNKHLDGVFSIRWAHFYIPESISAMSGPGSSSGLHHDYHDNLYILLRGEKQFSLFPPSDADKMYTYGEIAKIHHNGRIVYKGQV